MRKYSLLLLTVIFAALSVVFTTGCQPKEKGIEITQLDSLNVELNKIEALFTEIQVSEVEKILISIDVNIDSAAAICKKKNLTLSKEEGTFFGRYQALKSGLKKFGTRYNNIKEELVHCKGQIAALKQSISENKFDAVAANKYFSDEANAVKNVTQTAEQLHGVSVYVVENFAIYEPQVQAKIAELAKRTK